MKTDYWQQQNERVEHIREFMINNLHQKINFQKLAREYGITYKTLWRFFITTYRQTPVAYVQHARMFHALYQLVFTSHTIRHIALSVAYKSERNFITAFHRFFGFTPGYVRETTTSN